MRDCGDCTACCEGWVEDRIEIGSKVIEMRPGKPCEHCTDRGCGIYKERPTDPCRVFNCAWLLNEADFPDDMRPDRCGAIVLVDRPWKDWDVVQAMPVGAEIPLDTLESLRRFTQNKNIPFVFYEREKVDGRFTGGGRQRAYGSPEFASAVKNHATASDIVKF